MLSARMGRLAALAAAVTTPLTGLSLVSDGPALSAAADVRAASGWPVPIEKQQRHDRVQSHPDGSVSVARCSSGGDPTENRDLSTYNAAGTRINSVTSAHQTYFCLPNAVFGKQGEAIGVEEGWYNAADDVYETRVIAFRAGKRLWSVRVPNDCTGRYRDSMPKGMVQDSSGDLYLAVSQCSGLLLVGIRRQGAIKFSLKLGNDYSSSNFNQIFAYRDGLVVIQNAYGHRHPTLVRHFDTSGRENLARRYSFTMPDDDTVVGWTANYEGTLSFAIRRRSVQKPQCTEPGVNRVLIRTFTKTTQHVISGHCMNLEQIQATPNGGVVLTNHYSLGWSDADATPLLLITKGGAQIKLQFSPLADTDWLFRSVVIQVGLNGNILAKRDLRTQGRDPFYFSEWSLFSSDGSLRGVYSSRSLFDERGRGDAFMASLYAWTTTNSYLYAAMCQKEVPYWCNEGTLKLYKIPFSKVSYDYLNGKLQGVAAPKPPLNLVVAGDSFSSGEGAPPFETGTDTGTNKCHRSQQAYAHQLELNPAWNYRLQGFAACSGALSAHLIARHSGYNLPPQMNTIKASTDIVVFTAGGNDVGFADFATACTLGTCTGPATRRILKKITSAEGALYDRYRLIRRHMNSIGSKAKVYVVGYPYLVPIGKDRFLDTCSQLSDEEFDMIRLVTDRLNTAIALQARRAGFTFISATAPGSPFTGRQLCTANPAFNGVHLWPNVEYSYHPNAAGQRLYAVLVKRALG